jgi:hypothetical protein
LLDDPALDDAAPAMDGDDRDTILRPRYEESTQTIHLGANLVARPVPAAVWEYQQGAYPVVRNYLKERENRSLSLMEFDDFRLMIAAVRLTIERLPALDELLAQVAAGALSGQELGLVPDASGGLEELGE